VERPQPPAAFRRGKIDRGDPAAGASVVAHTRPIPPAAPVMTATFLDFMAS